MTGKKLTRLLSLLLTVALMFSLVALPVYAGDADDGADSGETAAVSADAEDAGEADNTGGTTDNAESAETPSDAGADDASESADSAEADGTDDGTAEETDEAAEGEDGDGTDEEAATVTVGETYEVASLLTSAGEKTDSSVASVTIGETTTYYDNITDAITAAETSAATVAVFGEGIEDTITITSGQNITLDFQTDYYGDIVIDEGGILTLSSTWGTGGNATVIGVTLSSGATLEVSGGTISQDLKINGGTATVSSGNVGVVTVTDGSLSMTGGTVSQSLTVSGGEVTMTGGTVSGSSDDTAVNINGGIMSVSGGTIKGHVEVSSGELNISGSASLTGGLTVSGGTVTMTGGTVSISASNANSAIIVNNGTVNISAGTVTGKSDFGGNAVSVSGGSVALSGGTYTGQGSNAAVSRDASNITITGGTYSSDVTSYASGTVTANGDGTYTVTTAATYVATVTDNDGNVTSYTTLAEAAEYANSLATGSSNSTTTIRLLKDITLTEQVTLKNTGTTVRIYLYLDLNDHTITADVANGYALYLGSSGSNGMVTVQNGTINATANAYGAIEIDNEAAILNSLTLTGQTAGHGVLLIDSVYGSKAVFTDLTITATDGYCMEIAASGSSSNLSLKGTNTFTQTASEGASEDQINAGIYMGGCSIALSAASGSTLNVSSDGYGVYIKGSSRFSTYASGTITGKTKAIYVDSSYSGTYDALIVYASCTAAINGGIASDATDYMVSVRGGNYDAEVDANYVESGYKCVLDETEGSDTNGRYIIEEDYVAEVYNGDTLVDSYNSLSSAISGATSGYTVKLIQDCSGTSAISIGKNLTIDLNGYTYTSSATDYAFSMTNTSAYTLTIKDSCADSGGAIVCTGNASNAIGVYIKFGELIVQDDAKISSTYGFGIYVGGYAAAYKSTNAPTVTIKDTATVSGGVAGIAVYGDTKGTGSYGPTVNVTGGTVEGGSYGIAGNGSTSYPGPTFINISGGTVQGTNTGDSTGIYHPQVGTVTVSGGTVTGYSAGIEMRAGTLNVSGGEITSTSEAATTYTANGSGTTVVGAGIAISQHSTNNAITVNVTGGEISGATGIYEVNTFAGTNTSAVTLNISEDDENETSPTIKSTTDGNAIYSESISGKTTGASSITTFAVSGGKFSSQVAEAYCAETYAPTTTADTESMYTVVKGVASITTTDEEGTETTTYYATLDAALTAANDGDTITLLADITLSADLTASVSGTVTLDLAGKNLTIENTAILTIDESTTVTIVDNSTAATGVVTNNGIITVNGTLDIRDLGYTTDAETAGGLLGQTNGKITLGSTGVFIVPDVWATQWSSLGAWTPNWTSATSSSGIFSSAEAGATVYSFGVGWTCGTAFEATSYSSGTTYWTSGETYLVEYYKTSRGGDSIDEETSSTWTYPDAVEDNTIFAGWYTEEGCTTVYEATSGVAYARFVTLSYDYTDTTSTSTETGVINFLGGSLRMDYGETYDQTSLRFGYEINIPTNCEQNSWYWIWTVGTSTTEYKVTGQYYSNNLYHEYSAGSTTRSNLVITGVPEASYSTNINSTLYVVYKTADGTTVTAKDTTARIRSVGGVAALISQSTDDSVTSDEKTYASNILSKITES